MGYEVASSLPCHPERSVAESNCEAAPKAGSTQSGATNPIVDPQNAMRFDFTKSAICRRFCKVRLLKHPTGMFYPLRMTQRAASCSIILYLLYPYQLRFANCASLPPCLAAARSRSGSDTTPWCHSLPSRRFATPGEGFLYIFLRKKRMKSVVYFRFRK